MNGAPGPLWQQAQGFTARRRWADASSSYRQLLQSQPDFIPAWLELSMAEDMLGHYRAAHDATLQAVSRARGLPPMAAMAIAHRLRRFERMDVLLRWIEQTRFDLQLPPERLVELAMFFSSGGAHARAVEWTDRALQLAPSLAVAHHVRGLLHMFSGDNALAAASFTRAITLQPGLAPAYPSLAKVAPATADANRVDALRTLLRSGPRADADRAAFGYALHHELHDLGDYNAAWQALRDAHAAQRRAQPYDLQAHLRLLQQVRDACTANFVNAGAALDDPLTPLFIVGLHRSGTTLLERILGGHPDIADAGETNTFPAQLRYAADRFGDGVISAEIAARIPSLDYPAIGHGFLDAMRWRARGKPFVTEKLNPNFAIVGLILRALPQARIVDMRRDPADTCFSNLRQMFVNHVGYADDPIEMADFCKAHHNLVQHWAAIAPTQVLTVHYEQLVAAPDAVATALAAHCGLPMDAGMLQLDRSVGMVATASATQVRQGILRNRGKLWADYQTHLQPMLDRLAAHGLL